MINKEKINSLTIQEAIELIHPIISKKNIEYSRNYNEIHKDLIRKSQKKYYQKNKEQLLVKRILWRQKNIVKCREYQKKYTRKWRRENQEKAKEIYKRYYQKNRESRQAYGNEYYHKHKDRINERRRKDYHQFKTKGVEG